MRKLISHSIFVWLPAILNAQTAPDTARTKELNPVEIHYFHNVTGVKEIEIDRESLIFNNGRSVADILRNSEKTNPLTQPGSPLTRHVIVEYNNHYFIGADNGIFSLLIEAAPTAVYEIDFGDDDEEHTFPVKTVFARAAAMIAAGQHPDTFGHKINELNQRTIIAPTISHNLIIGTVIYIDSYGNAIFNISKSDFEKHTIGKSYKLVLRGGSHEIDSIRKTYNEVPEGEVVALFDSSGHLEIAINKGVEGNGGGAAGLLGLRLGDTIRVEF